MDRKSTMEKRKYNDDLPVSNTISVLPEDAGIHRYILS
jgi:hypothetical protein